MQVGEGGGGGGVAAAAAAMVIKSREAGDSVREAARVAETGKEIDTGREAGAGAGRGRGTGAEAVKQEWVGIETG
jgi:hypothetical protein